ncbi:hypothetical protein [Flavobacterium sp. I3-2]|uniref:hypothetical protein n=1 Tax=Flavobacterium sp. I3-2 TaxID=2748319 RepID=UPI0015A83C28|nr:hypothetical protein [Flavobacterium sp. I3-2]
MKKVFLIVALFIIPIVAYLFFASGVNNFVKLPVVTPNVPELPNLKTQNDSVIQLKNRITILGFPGNNINEVKGNITNLCHKIYSKNMEFVDFQVVYVAPKGTETEINSIVETLSRDADLSKWFFVFATPEEIKDYYAKLNLIGGLDLDNGTSNVFIIDKELNLRGRKGTNKKGEEEYREGYNTTSAADLHNEMSDDVKVILAEYRLALKKNNKEENVIK